MSIIQVLLFTRSEGKEEGSFSNRFSPEIDDNARKMFALSKYGNFHSIHSSHHCTKKRIFHFQMQPFFVIFCSLKSYLQFLGIFTSIWLIVQAETVETDDQTNLNGFANKKEALAMDPTNLDIFFFRAAVSALMKAKADSILRTLPPIERIIHRQCQDDSDGRLHLLAKCLVSLFNQRDFALDRGGQSQRNDDHRMKDEKLERPALEKEEAEMPNWMLLLRKQLLWEGANKGQNLKAVELEKKREHKSEEKSDGNPSINGKKKNLVKIAIDYQEDNEKSQVSPIIPIREETKLAVVIPHGQNQQKLMVKPIGFGPNALAKNFAMFNVLNDGRAAKRRRKWKDLANISNGQQQEQQIRKRRKRREIGKGKINLNPSNPPHNKLNYDEFKHMKNLQKYPHVQKLVRIERLYRLVEQCNDYIQRKDAENNRFLQGANLPLRLSTDRFERSPLLGLAESQLKETVQFDKLSILSPKLLSIFPATMATKTTSTNSSRNGTTTATALSAMESLLSPTFLSFHEQGDFSLPHLLKLVFTNNAKETLPWLDLLLELSGAAATLDKLLAALEPSVVEIETKIFPAIQRLETLEKRFQKLWASTGNGQREEMDKRGYTFLDHSQSRLIGLAAGDDDELSGDMSADELEALLEADIRAIARMSEMDTAVLTNTTNRTTRRAKRTIPTAPYGQIRMLDPFYFVSQFNDSAILRRVTISPRAFSAEILTANLGRFDVLSPEAFVPSILSPRAAIAHILSPTAFNSRILSPQTLNAEVLNPRAFDAKILSPRAFSAYVLSPRLLATEILTPKAFEIRVLNPSTLMFYVLSPNLIGIKVGSPISHSLVVLSPSIMNPGFLSEGHNNVEIMSPHILGD